jgi:hypothetical protein
MKIAINATKIILGIPIHVFSFILLFTSLPP